MDPLKVVLALALAVGSGAAAADAETESRSAANELIQRLGAALKREMAAGGPERAVTVCRDIASTLAGELSRETGARITRVSLKVRNPLLGLPDAWEQAVLMDFDRRQAAGEKPETMERSEIVEEPHGRYLRYMKALPVQPMCLACHGDKEALAAPVKSHLAEAYPHDRSTGYAMGQVRGAVTVKKLLESKQ
jgi:hypothetical protein